MPDHPVALELLDRTGPLAVSSANLTGSPPATTVEEAEEMLGDSVEVYLDGGASPGDIAVDDRRRAPVDVPRVLREGAMSLARAPRGRAPRRSTMPARRRTDDATARRLDARQ